MNIVVLASTLPELGAVTAASRVHPLAGNLYQYTLPSGKGSFQVLIGGVGIPATVFHLTKYMLEYRPQLVIQAGIAGAYDRSLDIGQAVIVQQDRFATLGAEEEDRLLNIYELGLSDPQAFPFHDGWLHASEAPPSLDFLPKVSGITVDTTTGTEATRILRAEKYHPHIESMEGAACLYVCAQLGVHAIQLRTISNYVEKRNKLNWNIPLAVSNLQKPLFEYLETTIN